MTNTNNDTPVTMSSIYNSTSHDGDVDVDELSAAVANKAVISKEPAEDLDNTTVTDTSSTMTAEDPVDNTNTDKIKNNNSLAKKLAADRPPTPTATEDVSLAPSLSSDFKRPVPLNPDEKKETKKDDDSSDSDSEDEGLPKMRRIRSAIKLNTLTQDIPIKLGRRSFRTLPTPDMDKVRKAATLPAYMSPEDVFRIMSGTNHEDDRGPLNVKFDSVNIRSYDQTIGDNPSVSYGTPVALDWQFQEQKPVALEEYETERDGKRRPFKKLGLNYYQRKAILEGQGSSEQDIKKAKKKAEKDKFMRGVTKYFLPVMAVEDAAESALRKMKRSFGKNKTNKRASVS